MGGIGSGRWGGRPTVEGTRSYVLAVSLLKRQWLTGTAGGCVTFGDGFKVLCLIRAPRPGLISCVLMHQTRTEGEKSIPYVVSVAQSEPRFGGWRWWWVCPATGRRVLKLYLPLGGSRFLSRQAYRLGYASQRESRRERLMRRARKLHRALGGDGLALGHTAPPKPKGMRWRTYERKIAAWRAADKQALGTLSQAAVALHLGRLGFR
jgi:hypothetical protein